MQWTTLSSLLTIFDIKCCNINSSAVAKLILSHYSNYRIVTWTSLFLEKTIEKFWSSTYYTCFLKVLWLYFWYVQSRPTNCDVVNKRFMCRATRFNHILLLGATVIIDYILSSDDVNDIPAASVASETENVEGYAINKSSFEVRQLRN